MTPQELFDGYVTSNSHVIAEFSSNINENLIKHYQDCKQYALENKLEWKFESFLQDELVLRNL